MTPEAAEFAADLAGGLGKHRLPPLPGGSAELLPMFRSRRRIWKSIRDAVEPTHRSQAESIDFLMQVWDGLKQWDRLTEQERRAKLEGMTAEDCQAYRQHWADVLMSQQQTLHAEIHGSPVPENDDIGSAVTSPGWQFLVRVWLPCLLIYQTLPTRLFRKARQGDIEAIEHLLRLSKAVAGDRQIAAHIAEHGDSPHHRRRIAKAYSGRIRRLKRQRAKLRLAALLRSVAKMLNMHLSQAEIRELFDAAAEARTSGAIIDLDLGEDPASFERQMRRNAKFDLVRTNPDKKKK